MLFKRGQNIGFVSRNHLCRIVADIRIKIMINSSKLSDVIKKDKCFELVTRLDKLLRSMQVNIQPWQYEALISYFDSFRDDDGDILTDEKGLYLIPDEIADIIEGTLN